MIGNYEYTIALIKRMKEHLPIPAQPTNTQFTLFNSSTMKKQCLISLTPIFAQ